MCTTMHTNGDVSSQQWCRPCTADDHIIQDEMTVLPSGRNMVSRVMLRRRRRCFRPRVLQDPCGKSTPSNEQAARFSCTFKPVEAQCCSFRHCCRHHHCCHNNCLEHSTWGYPMVGNLSRFPQRVPPRQSDTLVPRLTTLDRGN